MFTYHYARYHVPDQEKYKSLSELLQRAWADMEFENAYPKRVTIGGKVLIDEKELVNLTWFQAPEDASDPSFDTYFDEVAARYAVSQGASYVT